ncbi:MAG: cell division protein ZapA [Thermodesulfobacteriota bacterium]
MKSAVKLEILGREYNIKSDEEEERVKKVGEYINRKVREITQATSNISTLNIVILTALNIANDYFDLLEEKEELKRVLGAKTGHLAELIQSVIRES